MANTIPVILSGGPCGGTHEQISLDQLKIGAVTCQGTVYVKDRPIPGTSGWYFTDQAEVAARSGGPGKTAHVTQAWTRWMHALGHTGPDSHNRLQRATYRVSRIGR